MGAEQGTMARTGQKGVAEIVLGVVTAIVVIISDNVAALGLGAEGAVGATLITQIVLQGLRRIGRDRSAGVPH